MARDRIWRWDTSIPEDERPDGEDLYEALLDYFNVEACWEMLTRTTRGYITVTLPGANQALAALEGSLSPRWFEVYVDETHVDVLTRTQDDYTEAVADGFYWHIKKRWKGEPG